MSSTTSVSTQKASYAQVAQDHFPTKDQAIVFDAIEGITVQQYTVALSKVVDPKNIRFVSRISHGRVCVYLNSKETADKITESRTKLHIGPHSLEARPLISKTKRIILSNVCPIIPHQLILDELAKRNIKPCSQVTFIRLGMSVPGLAHVLSFRRQLYIHPDDIPNLPPVLEINFDNTNYWIYLSTEKLSCFLCKEEGHLARFCKNVNTDPKPSTTLNEDTVVNTNTEQVVNITDNTLPIASDNNNKPYHHNICAIPDGFPPISFKRPLSSTATTSDKSNTVESPVKSAKKTIPPIKMKRANKRPKASQQTEPDPSILASQLTPANELISSNAHIYPLDLIQITDFLLLTFDNSKVVECALKFTSDIPALVNMLSDVKSQLTERNIKSRISRIIKKLATSDLEDSVSTDSSSMEPQEH